MTANGKIRNVSHVGIRVLRVVRPDLFRYFPISSFGFISDFVFRICFGFRFRLSSLRPVISMKSNWDRIFAFER